MANQINLGTLIHDYSLDKEDLAKYLFPANKYPVLALNRVIKHKSSLNETQIVLLSEFSGISIDVLFSNGWTMHSSDYVHTFRLGSFEARLNTRNGMTTLFQKGQFKIKRVIHTGDIVLADYIDKLNSLIKSFTDA